MSLKPFYEHGGITIYHGDCREVLPGLCEFDLCLTDPEYGIGVNGFNMGEGRATPVASTKFVRGDWDHERPAAAEFALLRSKSKNQIIWGGNYFADLLPASMGWLIWFKREGLPTRSYADCEMAWTSFNKPARLLSHRWDGFIRDGDDLKNGHPTQKPKALMAWALDYAGPVQSLVDPYMGSGTTLEVAKARGIMAVGIDREERYCEIAALRLAQDNLFAEI